MHARKSVTEWLLELVGRQDLGALACDKVGWHFDLSRQLPFYESGRIYVSNCF